MSKSSRKIRTINTMYNKKVYRVKSIESILCYGSMYKSSYSIIYINNHAGYYSTNHSIVHHQRWTTHVHWIKSVSSLFSYDYFKCCHIRLIYKLLNGVCVGVCATVQKCIRGVCKYRLFCSFFADKCTNRLKTT